MTTTTRKQQDLVDSGIFSQAEMEELRSWHKGQKRLLRRLVNHLAEAPLMALASASEPRELYRLQGKYSALRSLYIDLEEYLKKGEDDDRIVKK